MRRFQKRFICVVLVCVMMLQQNLLAAHASGPNLEGILRSDGKEDSSDEREVSAGRLADLGLTMEEVTADCYINETVPRNHIRALKKLEDWPSEKLLAAAKKEGLKISLGVDKAVHALADPSKLVDAEKKTLEYYQTIMITLLVEETDNSATDIFNSIKDPLSADNKLLQRVVKIAETSRKISTLDLKTKAELRTETEKYLAEKIKFPVSDDLKYILDGADMVSDFVRLVHDYEVLARSAETEQELVKEMAESAENDTLESALTLVSTAMEDSFKGLDLAAMEFASDIFVYGMKEVIKSAWKKALPAEFGLAVQLGTAVGDLITSQLFANGSMEENLGKLQCVGEVARLLIDTADEYSRRFQADTDDSEAGRKKRQEDAAKYVLCINLLTRLRKLSCDYSEAFVDSAMSGTDFEKIILIFDKGKKKDYDGALEGLIKDKQHILETEKLLLLRPLEQLFLYYPDEYAAMTVDDLPLDDYIVKIEEAYREQIDAVPDDYKEETLADSLSGKATVTVGKQDEKTDQKQDQKKDRKEDTADTGKTDGKNSSQDPADAAIDAFLANEAQCRGRDGNTFFYQDLQDAEKNYGFVYEAGPRLDLDNDGRNELILTGPYGGMFLDAENGTLAVFEEGGGTASVLSYGYYEGKCVVCHMDTSHAGRQEYHFDVYQGADQKTESFSLTAEYWDAPDQNRYDENSTFTFKDQQITMQEYEALLSEIFKK